MKRLISIFLFVYPYLLWSQKPKAVFLSDSVEVGSPVKLEISLSHKSSENVIFPDSNFNFSPFHFVEIEYFETETTDSISVDKAVYTLQSFSMDSILTISPYLIRVSDNEKIYADTARIWFKSLLKSKDLKSLKPKESVQVFEVEEEVNYPKIIYYTILFLLSAVIIIVYFGDWIVNKFRRLQFDLKQRRFISDFRKRQLETMDQKMVQETLRKWKNHLEWLDNQPISTMSSSEIFDYYKDERLASALKLCDTAIYGGMVSDQIPFAFHILQDFVIKRYKQERKSKY